MCIKKLPLLFLLLFCLVPTVKAAPPVQINTFEAAPCMFDPLIPGTAGSDIVCGYVTVPESHGNPAGPTLRLAVAIFKSTGSNPQPDPLFMAQGGPGGSTIEDFNIIAVNSPLRQQRDIVLFDQRGTLYSEPNLLCPEVTDAQVEMLSLPPEEAEPIYEEKLVACRKRLVEAGVNLSAFNSLENAADVESIRQALGYEDINFYGVSYGTLLGLHLMHNHPQHLRSVILDGVVPPQTNFIPMVPKNTERIFSLLFETCAANAECSKRYPNLEEEFFALVDRLNESPASVPLTDPETGQTTQARLSGDDLVDLVFQFFYLGEGVSIMPRVIADIAAKNYDFLQDIWPLLVFERNYSEGMYISVICAEDADFGPADIPLEGVRPYFADGLVTDLEEFSQLCELWDVDTLPGSVDDPVASNIPTLLLSGHFDPITPPYFAANAAQTLTNGYSFTHPTGSHGVAVNLDPCIDDIVSRFLDNPSVQPNSACLDTVLPVEFIAGNVIRVGLFGKFGRLDSAALVQTGLAGLFLVGLMSLLLVGPVVLIVNALRSQKTAQPHKWLRWGSWGLIFLFIGLAVLFVGGAMAALISAFLNNSMLVLSSVPVLFAPVFIIPYLLVALTVVIIVAAVLLWVKRAGSVWARLYYVFLALCAVGYIITLGTTGMLAVLI